MEVKAASIPGILILKPKRFVDARGFFSESYNKRTLAQAGIDIAFVQDNLSFSGTPLTLRGLHFQREPFPQAKLVSVLQGAVLDVVVDLRRSSEFFGRHFSIELSAAEGNQLFIPTGFAHGFLTLGQNTLFAYKASSFYSHECDVGIRFDDARLAIDWGVGLDLIVTSEKDKGLPGFDPDMDYFA
jgi:dTDP-4-dehydrorhamnose 3,5-epimerase